MDALAASATVPRAEIISCSAWAFPPETAVTLSMIPIKAVGAISSCLKAALNRSVAFVVSTPAMFVKIPTASVRAFISVIHSTVVCPAFLVAKAISSITVVNSVSGVAVL